MATLGWWFWFAWQIREHIGDFGCRRVCCGRAGSHVAPPVGGAIVVCRDCSPHGVARKAPRLAGASSRPMGHLALERSRLPNLSLPLLPRQCGVSRGGVGLGVLRSGSCVWPGMVQAWAPRIWQEGQQMAEMDQRIGWVDLEVGLGETCRAQPPCVGNNPVVVVPVDSRAPPPAVGQACDGCGGVVGTWVNMASKCSTSDNHLGQRLWHVSARQPTWLLEDGWQGEVWASSPRDSVKAANVVHHLGLSFVAWNTSWKGPNATKSQPPSEVWDFGQNPMGTVEVTLGEELSSVSEAE